MTSPCKPADPDEHLPFQRAEGQVPLSLRRQAWLAAALVLCPWLVTLFLSSPILQQGFLAIVSLLPGLLVVLHLQQTLGRHLAANHRSGEATRLFSTLGAATWITLLRGAAIVVLAGFLPLAVSAAPVVPPLLAWAPGLIYLGVALADLVDGYVARAQSRETELGKRLDIETDAAGLLVALLVAVVLNRLPAFTLLVGLAYYLFIFGIWWRQRRQLPVIALQSRPYARIIAGFQMGLVAMALLPIFNPLYTSIAALLVMAPLLTGFFRDWLVVSCRMPTDANQQTAFDSWAHLVLIQYLPIALRLLLLAGGIMAVVAGDVSTVAPYWHWAQILCCLLAGLGCMGRSSALLLTVLLSSNLSPFGTAFPALVLFGAAATLMLVGPGPLTCWSPEEDFLYRRQPKHNGLGGVNA